MSYSDKKAYKIIHKCGHCGRKMTFCTTGKFRVNANKNRLDVWLIYQCGKCGHTLNIPVYERVPPQKIPGEQYEKFLVNDSALASAYAADGSFLKHRRFILEK